MRAITVRQPWAWAIMRDQKDVENRSRNIAGDHRGRVAIHASLTAATNASDELWGDYQDDFNPATERGVIIGTANLWAVHRAQPGCCPNRGVPPFGSKWAMADHWHLCLSDPKPLAEPIPCRGALGLWTLPDDVAAALAERNSRDAEGNAS